MRTFSSAKTSCIRELVKHAEYIIRHVGTNDLKSERAASQIANSIILIANSLKNETNSNNVSLIVPRNDNFNNKVNEVNSRLTNMCQQRDIKAISHINTIHPAKHLNESQPHFNKYRTIEFASIFKNFLYNLS